MKALIEQLRQCGIIPIVVIDDDADAVPLAEALLRGGLTTMEVTFRTPAARGALSRISASVPSILLGAGTVITIEQANIAIEAGARYIVSPGLDPAIVAHCIGRGVGVIPGVLTATEIQAAIGLGLEVVKFFPAEAAGGLTYLKAVAAPFRTMRFIPTGGIDESNAGAYLAHPQVLACGGSWIVKSDLIKAKRFDEITRLATLAATLRRIPQ
jgi:2-dehydro-3-deoxyphosphogluconate aldolase/(4S)-4-hydroxy-2-oxoglutarate aldolase